jgi:CBS domain-containing protein
MQVHQILQSKGAGVFAVSADQTVAEAVRELNERRIGAVVVTAKDGRLIGILSERDIVRRLTDSESRVLGLPVKSLMTEKPVTCSPADSIERLMTLMTRHRVRHLPVVEDGKLAGLVSIGDVVKSRIEEVEQEAEALRAYIAS